MIYFRLARMQLRGQAAQLAIATVVIALGVALAAGILLANDALRQSFESSLGALSGRADLELYAIGGGTLDESLLDEVIASGHVDAAAPMVMGTATVVNRPDVKLAVVGIDMLSDANIRVYEADPTESAGIEDPLIFLSQGDSAIVPQSLAEVLELERGNRLELQTSTGRPALTVRGILRGKGVARANGGRIVIMDLYSAQAVLGAGPRLSRIDLVLAPGAEIEEKIAELRRVLPHHIGIARSEDRREKKRQLVAGFQALLDSISLLGLVLAALITANRLATVYQERLWEIGVLRGLGWPPRVLVRSLLAEALIFSSIGSLAGCALGVVFAGFVVGPVSDAMALNFSETVLVPRVEVSAKPLLLAAAAGIGSGILGAVWPAIRVARTPIAQVMARRRRRDGSHRLSVPVARIGVPCLAVLLLVVHFVIGPSPVLAVAIMGTVLLAGYLLIQPLLRFFGVAFGRVFGGAALIGAKDQSRTPSRAIGAALIIMTGLAVVVWLALINSSFQRLILDAARTGRSGADLLVDSTIEGNASGQARPRLAGSVLDELRQIEGVRSVGSFLLGVSENPETGLLVVSRENLVDPGYGGWGLKPGARNGAAELAAAGEGVLANTQLALDRGVEVGDEIELTTPSGTIQVEILGFSDSTIISSHGAIVMVRELYERHWHDAGVHLAPVLLAAGATYDEVRTRILEKLGGRYRFEIRNQEELDEWHRESVRQGFRFADALIILTLAVVLIGTGDALASNVVERTREIGAMRSFGYTPRAVGAMVVVQALAIGLSGAVLGVLVGSGLGIGFIEGLLPSILGWQLQVSPAFEAALLGVALCLVACVIGSIPPAVRSATVSPAVALRYE